MVPLTALLKAIAVITVPEQIVCDDGVTTATEPGFTSTDALLVQLPELGVMVNVTYNAAAVVLVKAPLMLPDPLFAIPVTVVVLFLVQL